jgi:nucleoside-diphosphate-sugar epimerase
MVKRVLVTGATGFVGHKTLAPLTSRGYEVHALHGRSVPVGPATWHQADLLDSIRVSQILEEVRPTHLLHLAWYMEHGKVLNSTENLRWVASGLNLLRQFVTCGGQRAVISGSCAEYDWSYGLCSESLTPSHARTLYGACKNGLRVISSKYAEEVGLSLAWGRIFFLYGPGEKEKRLVPSVVRAFQRREPVKCTHGNQFRDFLHIEDCSEAFVSLLDSPVEGIVNVASGRPVAIGEIVRTIASLSPGNESVPVEYGAIATPDDDPQFLVADVGRLTREVGWSPKFGLRDGLIHTMKSMCVPIQR